MPSSKKIPPKTKKTQVIVDQLETINPRNPLPIEGGRGFTTLVDAEYLPFLAPDDNYGKLLLECRLLSTTNNACVSTKKNYCAGSGFQLKENEDISDPKFIDWLKSLNLRNEPITEVNKKIFDAFFTYGNCPIEVVRFTVGRTRYFYIYVHNFLEWRLSRPDEDTGISHSAIQSKLFLRDGYVITADEYLKARRLPIYNPNYGNKTASKYRDGINWLRDKNGTERTLIWYKNSVTGFDNYGLPSNVAGLIYEKLEYSGARFNLDNLENNAVVSALLVLKGSLSQTEINKIGKKVIGTHTGDGKRGRVMVAGSEEGISGSDFHSFSTHKEGAYKDIDEVWTQKIILANEWDALMAGIIHSSSIGKGAGFLTKIMELKKNTVIIPAQRDLMEKVWVTILGLAKSWMGFKIDPEDLEIKNTIDISGLTDVDITPAVKVNEVREAKGLPSDPSDKGEKYLGELGADQKRGVYVKSGKTEGDSGTQQN